MDEIKFYESSDFKEIQRWYKKRSIEFNDPSILPAIGFVVSNVAAGFIYMTDAPVAFIEGFITNPDASSSDRNNALNNISECLISYAKNMGVKLIKCETKYSEIEKRSINFGFKSLGNVISLVKEL